MNGKFPYGRTKRKGRSILAHRLAWMLLVGKIPKGLCVLHRCDVPQCVRPSHLFLGTIADNVADMIHKGRIGPRRGLSGEANPRAKLTRNVVLMIRRLVLNGEITRRAASERFGIAYSTACEVVSGNRWKWLKKGMP